MELTNYYGKIKKKFFFGNKDLILLLLLLLLLLAFIEFKDNFEWFEWNFKKFETDYE